MSRIGRLPITVPSGVDVTIVGRQVTVTGPKGTLSRELPPIMGVAREGDTVVVTRPGEDKLHKSLHGLTRTLVSNMVVGVTTGYRKGLEIVPPQGISFEVENPTRLSVVGIDKELVGRVAARIRATRKPEPYKGKGVRYAGEQVRRKAGKAGKIGAKK